jgi:hypothetical protein
MGIQIALAPIANQLWLGFPVPTRPDVSRSTRHTSPVIYRVVTS